jgi:hypothetical protein
MKLRKKMQRGAIRTSDCLFVGAWLPVTLVGALDRAVTSLDSDRSKIIREALREKVLASPEGGQ